MSGLGQRVLAAAPAVASLALITGLGQLVAVLAGFAPAPGGARIAFGLGVAALLGVAAAPLIRASYAAVIEHIDAAARRPATAATPATPATAGPAEPAGRSPAEGLDARPRRSRHRHRGTRANVTAAVPSWTRLGVVAGAVLLLALVCWVRLGEPGRVAFGLIRTGFGLLVYAVPVLPLLALVPPPTPAPEPVPWEVVARRSRDRAEWLRFAWALLRALRDRLLGRPLGIVLVTLALFHLLRGSPGTGAGAYRLAGGLIGMLTAGPLTAVLSPAVALGLLAAVLLCAAAVTAGQVFRYLGRYPTVAVLAVLVVVPLVTTGVSHHVGYDHFLGVRGDRVVVIAGLAPHHRHEVHDGGVALADVPAPVHPALRAGLKVASRAEGLRIAAALADPARAAAESMPDGGGLQLKAGECFSFVGGSSNFRYTTPCNGEHTGEVFYVGRLPFADNPGAKVRDAAALGICEKAYGTYLGVPYGSSYLSMDPPVLEGGAWRPRPLVACVFTAVGPWPLKGTRTMAALQQKLDWSPGAGCGAEADGGLRLTAEQPGARCVAPGRAVPLRAGVPMLIDAEFAPLGRAAGGGRVGVGCLDGDATTGYYVTVGGDGVLELVKQVGSDRARLASGGKARSSPSPQTTITQVQVTCKVVDGGVQVAAVAGRNRQLAFTDKDRPITGLSPRLVVEAAEAPVAASVSLFTAVVAP
jgi:hypothetical protein